MKTRNLSKPLVAGVLAATLSAGALAEEKDSFSIAWTIYAGWVPWQYAEDSGIMKKWADKYDIEVDIVQVNDTSSPSTSTPPASLTVWWPPAWTACQFRQRPAWIPPH